MFLERVEIAGLVDPIIGQLIGVDLRQPPRMNQVTVRSGRALAPPGAGQGRSDSAIDALVSEGFARVRGLHPGDELIALVNGKRRHNSAIVNLESKTGKGTNPVEELERLESFRRLVLAGHDTPERRAQRNCGV